MPSLANHRLAIVALLLGTFPVSDGAHHAFHATTPSKDQLTVFAAASLTESFGELGRLMEQRHPGLTVRFNFAGSQQLAAQLEQGAEADVFASADDRWMKSVQEKQLLAAEPQIFARNRLVVIVPASNPARIDRLAQLSGRGIKLVLAADAVPAGRYSREVLQKLSASTGFEADYGRRVLANVVSQEENVKSVVTKVQLGEADAGMVYRSDVTPAVSRYLKVLDIPEESNVLASYPIATIRNSAQRALADGFVDLVLSAEGQSVLERHGFLGVEAKAGSPVPPKPR
ncbi:MAG: molybdate ABC transporter substrate-binding protein [Gemmatimonadota bacterium]